MSHLARFLINLVWLAASIGVLYLIGLILAEELAMPAWMPFDIHDGPWLAAFLKFFGVVLITPPFVALLADLFRIGATQARGRLFEVETGPITSLRLPPGVRWAAIVMGLGLSAAIIGVLWVMEEPWGIWLFASPLVLLGLYCAVVFAQIRVYFDQTHIVAMTPLLRWQRHDWADLEEMTLNREWQELRLHFADGRMARVSTMFNHLPDFVAFAQAKGKENEDARTA